MIVRVSVTVWICIPCVCCSSCCSSDVWWWRVNSPVVVVCRICWSVIISTRGWNVTLRTVSIGTTTCCRWTATRWLIRTSLVMSGRWRWWTTSRLSRWGWGWWWGSTRWWTTRWFSSWGASLENMKILNLRFSKNPNWILKLQEKNRKSKYQMIVSHFKNIIKVLVN